VHIGIDPGLQGAVAILDDAGALVALHDVPTLTLPNSRGTRHEYDLPGMVAILAPYVQNAHVLIEEAQAMPGQGVRSMFTIGLGSGAWLGILGALGLVHTREPPCRVETPPGPSWRERGGTATGDTAFPSCGFTAEARSRARRGVAARVLGLAPGDGGRDVAMSASGQGTA
jgi:hypothetical protein